MKHCFKGGTLEIRTRNERGKSSRDGNVDEGLRVIAGSKLVAKLRGNFGQQLCRQGWFNGSVPKFPCSEIMWKHYVSVKPSHAEYGSSVAGKGIRAAGERSCLAFRST